MSANSPLTRRQVLAALLALPALPSCGAPAKRKPAMTDAPVPFDDRWTPYGGTWTREGTLCRVQAGPGHKLVASRPTAPEFVLEADIRLTGENPGQAGVLFRVTEPSIGPDSLNGYYVGLDARTSQVVFGRMDAEGAWTPLVTRAEPIKAGAWHRVKIVARKNRIQGFVQRIGAPAASPAWPLFDVEDSTHVSGAVGLRTVETDAEFRDLIVRAPGPAPSGPTWTNEGGLIPDLADPGVLQHEGEYYAYGTGGRGIKVYRSKDLVHWSAAAGATDGYALHPDDSWGDRMFWAPEVYRRGDEFLMHYSVQERLAAAVAASPLGPFRQAVKAPFHENTPEIDSHVFLDDDGRAYLYFVRFTAGNVIHVAELNSDLVTIRENTIRECIRQSQDWERNPHVPAAVNEGPFILKHKGIYYLTYSANHYQSEGYGVGYARSKSPMGPWTKYPYNPVMASNAYVHGAGHHAFTKSPDGKELFIVYHTHRDLEHVHPRKMVVDRCRFAPDPDGGPDVLEVYGPTLTSQPMPSGSR